MNTRHTGAPGRSAHAPHRASPIHRGPQAMSQHTAAFHHAPNAALLIDFDNVTMGIRSDLDKELRNLLGSDIIKGKVAVQRAYADWRRYQQYVTPLTAASIDLVWAPAYGASKKNATDIRLAIDALELVFTRPEIGTFILLSGDSDFSSLVIKLKEYGKYVIGVGIRESSSDLLVSNCDEYYSYNALAGLVSTRDEHAVQKWDPWELVVEAMKRMKRNGDVMRSDRLKQVMQEIDASFDEKDLGMSKFSRFVQEAQHRGLVTLRKLDSGQMEIDLPEAGVAAAAAPTAEETRATPSRVDGDESREERPRRGRRGRGRGRDRERPARPDGEVEMPVAREPEPVAEAPREARPSRPERGPRPDRGGRPPREGRPDRPPRHPEAQRPSAADEIGVTGERLTRDEAFDLVRRAAASGNGSPLRAREVRVRARELLGRDSASLAERFFDRILRDAHDADLIDLRRRGDDFEVALAAETGTVAEQMEKHAARAIAAAPPPAVDAAAKRGGIRGRGSVRGGKAQEIPPELLLIGAVDHGVSEPTWETPAAEEPAESEPAPERAARPSRGRKRAAGPEADPTAGGGEGAAEPATKKPRRPRARRKTAPEA